MPRTKRDSSIRSNGVLPGFEEKLWAAAGYEHVVPGLVFLKYISDVFEERHDHLLKEAANPRSDLYVREERARYTVAEDRDEYKAENVFRVSKQAHWSFLQANAKPPTIGKLIDEAMMAIERELVVAGRALERLRAPRARSAAAWRVRSQSTISRGAVR
jgi:type I restriction enzyme M protein